MSEQAPAANESAQPGQPKRSQGRRRRPKGKKPVDLWRAVPELPDPEPIITAKDPTAVLSSLGDPPLHGQGAGAEHYMAAVVQRAAGLATALALAAGLLAQPDVVED